MAGWGLWGLRGRIAVPFAAMLTDHLRNRTNLRTGAGMASNPWLFPGRNTGKHLDPQTMQMRLHNRGISVLGARNSCRTSWTKYLLPLWPTYWAKATPAPSTTHNWRLSPGRATSLSGRELVVNERNCLHTNGFQALQDAKPRRTLSTYRLAGGAGFPPWMLSPPTPRPGCWPSHGRPARES